MSRGSKPLSLFVLHRRRFARIYHSLSHHRLSSTPSISHFLLLRFRRCPLSFSSFILLRPFFVSPLARLFVFFLFCLLSFSTSLPFPITISPPRFFSTLERLILTLDRFSLVPSFDSPRLSYIFVLSFPLVPYTARPFLLSRIRCQSTSPYRALERFSVLSTGTQCDFRFFLSISLLF